MRKKFYFVLSLVFIFLFTIFGKQIVFADSLPEEIRVIYSFAYIYNVDESIIEVTDEENRAELVEKTIYLHDVFTVTNQTSKMFEIEFEKDEQTFIGYIYKAVVIDNALTSPEKYLQTNATITKQAQIFQKDDEDFIKVENITLEIGTKIRLLEKLSSQNEYTLISFNYNNSVLVYYVQTNSVKADGLSRSILTAITLIFISISVGSVLLTIFKRNNKLKKQALLNEDI